MDLPAWAWIPLTVFGAFAQTVRNAAQRQLTATVGTLGATLVRFLYGLPFIALWLVSLLYIGDATMPAATWALPGWLCLAALGQMMGTVLLLRAMAERSFAIGLLYSKSEIIQVALFSAAFLGEPLTPRSGFAIILATAGAVLLSPRAPRAAGMPQRRGWIDSAALYGLGAGAAFALSIVGYRGGALSMVHTSPVLAAAATLFWSQLIQTVVLGAWLSARRPTAILSVLREWRASGLAGIAGATASVAGVSALALHSAPQVRTLALVEVLFAYVVSVGVLHETISRREAAGIVLILIALVIITTATW